MFAEVFSLDDSFLHYSHMYPVRIINVFPAWGKYKIKLAIVSFTELVLTLSNWICSGMHGCSTKMWHYWLSSKTRNLLYWASISCSHIEKQMKHLASQQWLTWWASFHQKFQVLTYYDMDIPCHIPCPTSQYILKYFKKFDVALFYMYIFLIWFWLAQLLFCSSIWYFFSTFFIHILILADLNALKCWLYMFVLMFFLYCVFFWLSAAVASWIPHRRMTSLSFSHLNPGVHVFIINWIIIYWAVCVFFVSVSYRDCSWQKWFDLLCGRDNDQESGS